MNAFKRSVVIAVLALLCCQAFAADAKESAAAKFATDWLALLDAGKYDQCWKQTSPSFQSSIRKDKWESQLGHWRHLLGKNRVAQTLECCLHQQALGSRRR